jgi:putative mRNA 3-end processing factor
MPGLSQSLKECEKILVTPATKDLIDVMKGPLYLMGGNVETLEYYKTIRYMEETITFLKADHILGATQILVTDAQGTRIAYTGDFRIDETPVIEADILIIEATYGSPACRRNFPTDIREVLVNTVQKGLRQGSVYVFGYHGKLQEVMEILHLAGIKAPFIASERIFQISKISEKHGMRLGRILLSAEDQAKELIEKNAPCINFCHMNTKGNASLRSFRVTVSGWEFDTPMRETIDNDHIVALSDHSDFNGLLEYARRSKPRQIITDNHRVGHAETLAREIHKHLGIPATALPKR